MYLLNKPKSKKNIGQLNEDFIESLDEIEIYWEWNPGIATVEHKAIMICSLCKKQITCCKNCQWSGEIEPNSDNEVKHKLKELKK